MIHYVDAEADLRTVFDGPIIRLAQRLKAEGRIRSIGLSSHKPPWRAWPSKRGSSTY